MSRIHEHPTHYTIAEAAAVLGVSVPTIRRRIKDGTLRAQRFGPTMVRIPAASVEQAGWRDIPTPVR